MNFDDIGLYISTVVVFSYFIKVLMRIILDFIFKIKYNFKLQQIDVLRLRNEKLSSLDFLHVSVKRKFFSISKAKIILKANSLHTSDEKIAETIIDLKSKFFFTDVYSFFQKVDKLIAYIYEDVRRGKGTIISFDFIRYLRLTYKKININEEVLLKTKTWERISMINKQLEFVEREKDLVRQKELILLKKKMKLEEELYSKVVI